MYEVDIHRTNGHMYLNLCIFMPVHATIAKLKSTGFFICKCLQAWFPNLETQSGGLSIFLLKAVLRRMSAHVKNA